MQIDIRSDLRVSPASSTFSGWRNDVQLAKDTKEPPRRTVVRRVSWKPSEQYVQKEVKSQMLLTGQDVN